LCDRDNYLLELVRYIHLNPVRAGLSKRVDGYRWSSHSNYLSGDDKGVSVSAVLEQFGKRRGEAIRQYRQFITEGLGDGHREEYYKVIDQRFLGDEKFVEEVRGKLEEPEIIRYPVEIELRDISKLVCDGFGIRTERVYQREKSREVSQLRWIIGKLACEEAGYRLVEVAGFFGRDAGVMSRGLRLLEERLAQEKELQKGIARLRLAIQSGRKRRIAITHA
jgi:hypothetical protein